MAAADCSLTPQLNCAVCSDELKHPKFIGPCNHTFCKECIEQYWVARQWEETIPCPQCRQVCPIPMDGVDGLKDNFMVASIIETYRKQKLQRDANQVDSKCIQCSNKASSFCKECDMRMCPLCKEKHDFEPNTRDHDVFGICPSHGYGLLFFCRSCKQAVCSGCRVSDHNQGDHNVTSIRPVIGDLRSTIHVSTSELADDVEEEETKLSQLRDIIAQKSKSSEEINNRLRSLDTRRKEMQTKIELGWEVVTARITIDTESITNLASTCHELADLVRASRERDTSTEIEEIRRLIGEVGLGARDMEQGRDLKQDGQRVIKRNKAERPSGAVGLDIDDTGHAFSQRSTSGGQEKRIFRLLKKRSDTSFSRNPPCHLVRRVEHLSGDRLVALGCKTGFGWAEKIIFYDAVSSSLTSSISEGVEPARDMAVSSTGALIVTRTKKPPIRVFKPDTGAYRDIKINHHGQKLDKLNLVETDHSGNIFAVTSFPYHLIAICKGKVIQSVQLDGYANRMAFCAVTGILYIVADNGIFRFHWRNKVLKEISPYSHGVNGLVCYDVCTGSGGEVLVACKKSCDVVIYQVAEGQCQGELEWRKIRYQDDENRSCDRFHEPRICMKDDKLWLAIDGRIEKFDLL